MSQPIAEDITTITPLIEAMKCGDRQAFARLVRKYEPHVKNLIRRKLRWVPKAVEDESDVFISVVDSIWRGVVGDRFDKLVDRDNLWALLQYVAINKSISMIRRQSAKKRCVIGEEIDESRSILAPARPVDADVMLTDAIQQLLACLANDEDRLIVRRCLEGYSNREIAAELDRAERSIERRLKWIRRTWSEEAKKNGDD